MDKPHNLTVSERLELFAQQIIMKYGTVENLPRFKYNWMRLHLKELGKMTSIPFDLLSKMGRKTKAHKLLNETGLSLEATAISLELLLH